MSTSKPKVLITAYAVNPYKGSEDGTGWNIIFQIAKHNKVIAITRENNQPAIDKYFKENHVPHRNNIQFEYFDLPYYLRFWKKKSRGALLYFYLWQIGIVFFIRSKKIVFDVAHHLNFHSDWMPSFLWVFGKPFVWGPIGHHASIPKEFILETGGRSAYYMDRLKWYTKKFFWNFDPFLKITKSKAQKIFCINSSIQQVLKLPVQKVVPLPAIATEQPRLLPRRTDEFQVLSIGRFVPLKGFDLTIESFAKCYHSLTKEARIKLKLILIGKGPMKNELVQLSQKFNIEDAITFIDWIDRKDLDQYFANASVFLFPSHEGAGMVVPEAFSFGVPVICLDNIGPGESIDQHSGVSVPVNSRGQVVEGLADALTEMVNHPEKLNQFAKGAELRYQNHFTWERKGKIISEIYRKLTPMDTEVPKYSTSNS